MKGKEAEALCALFSGRHRRFAPHAQVGYLGQRIPRTIVFEIKKRSAFMWLTMDPNCGITERVGQLYPAWWKHHKISKVLWILKTTVSQLLSSHLGWPFNPVGLNKQLFLLFSSDCLGVHGKMAGSPRKSWQATYNVSSLPSDCEKISKERKEEISLNALLCEALISNM